MCGFTLLRKLPVLILFLAFSSGLLAQTNYSIDVSTGADAAEPATDGYAQVTVSPVPDEFMTVVACVAVTPGGTATEGVDFEYIGQPYEICDDSQVEVMFDNVNTTAQIPITVIDDAVYEGTESVNLGVVETAVWCECNDTASAGSSATVYIEDDDDTATFMVYSWFSDGNPMPVDINLVCSDADIAQPNLQASQGNPAVFNLTGVDPSNDCTATAPAVDGYSMQTWSCTEQETGPLETSYCYVDYYYEPVTVDVQAVSIAREPDRNGAFELMLSGSPPWGGMNVNVSVGGTATPGGDYEEIVTPVMVPYGTTRYRVPVAVIDDTDKEDTETVVLGILEGDTGQCGEYQQGLQAGSKRPAKQADECGSDYLPGENTEASVKLFDDDWPKVSVETLGDAAEPDTQGSFLLTVSEPAPEGGLNVSFLVEGTAVSGEDFQPLSNPVLIPAGATRQEVAVIPIDDQLFEPTETVEIQLLPGEIYSIGIGNEIRATVNIQDDDPDVPPDTAGINVTPTSGLVTSENGSTAQFQVVLTSAPSAAVDIPVESSDTTEGTVAPTSLSFNAETWSMPQSVVITGQPDDELDGDQAYTIMLGAAVSEDVNYAGLDPADVSVTNTDTTPEPPEPGTAQFSMQVYSVHEEDGVASIGIQRVGNPEAALTARFSTVDDSDATTASAGEDYTSVPPTDIVWDAGDDSEKFVEVAVFENGDAVGESNIEVVELLLEGDDFSDSAMLEIESDVVEDIVAGLEDEIDSLPPNQGEVVNVILDSCPLGNNVADFQGLCTAIVVSAASEHDVASAIKAATPDDAAAVRSSGMQTTNVQISAVDGRLGTLRGGGGAGFSASGFSMAYGDVMMNSSLLKSFISAFDQNNPALLQANGGQDDENFIDEFGRWGAWVSGRVVFGEKDPTTNQVEYDFDTAGLTFGLDYRFTDEFVAGVAVGYSNTDAKLGRNDGELDSKGYSVSLYGTWFKSDRFYLGGSMAYGSNEYDHERNVRYTINRPASAPSFLPDSVFDVDQTMAADYDGDQYSFSLSGGWDFNKDGWTFGPTFRLNYVNVDVDPYDETMISSNLDPAFATTGWAVHIDSQNYESLQPSIGFEFTKAVSASWGVMIPQGYIDIVSELSDGGELVTGSFLGDNNNVGFALQTDDFEETFARAGLGLGFILKNNKSAYIMVDADLGRDLLSTYYINAGFRWQF